MVTPDPCEYCESPGPSDKECLMCQVGMCTACIGTTNLCEGCEDAENEEEND